VAVSSYTFLFFVQSGKSNFVVLHRENDAHMHLQRRKLTFYNLISTICSLFLSFTQSADDKSLSITSDVMDFSVFGLYLLNLKFSVEML
jgi:hypothetical protein